MPFCELALLHYQIYLIEININLKFYFTTKANWHMYYLLFPHFFFKNKTSAIMHKMRLITLPIDNMYIYILSIKRLTSRIKGIRILIFGTIPSCVYS